MITLTIADAADTMQFTVFEAPVISTPIINETDVETVDGNISTYYSSTKRQFEFNLSYLDAETYRQLTAFVARQYEARKYPTITIEGAENLNIDNLTAKISLNRQEVVDECGVVEGVTVTFRESRQMP